MFSAAAIRRVVKLMKCVQHFGAVRGPLLYLQLISNRRGLRLQLPGHRAPLTLRPEAGDLTVFDKIFIQREYALPAEAEPADPRVIVDAGANIGLSAVFFAQRYPRATVVAVEPEAGNYRLLLQNTRPYPNIIPVQAALWPRRARLRFVNTNHGTMAFQVQEAPAAEPGCVEALTVPDILRLAGASRIDLLKLDIECAEQELFGAEDLAWLDAVGAIVIELHDWIRGGSSMAFYRALGRYRFRQFLAGENVIVVKDGPCDVAPADAREALLAV